MPLEAYLKAICDGCDKVVERLVQLDDKTARGIMEEDGGVTTYASDLWSWAVPYGWLQVPEDKVTRRKYLFFHDDDCYKEWLRKQGRVEEVEVFEKAVWVA